MNRFKQIIASLLVIFSVVGIVAMLAVDHRQSNQNDAFTQNMLIEKHSECPSVSQLDCDQLNAVTRYGEYSISQDQQDVLDLALAIGQAVGVGHYVQAIAMQETHAGAYGTGIGDTHLPPMNRSYGIMQVRVDTARWVLKNFSEQFEGTFKTSSDPNKVLVEELIVRLIYDDHFNILIGALNLKLLKEHSPSLDHALVAYNVGLSGSKRINHPEKFPYVVELKKKLEMIIIPYNTNTALSWR